MKNLNANLITDLFLLASFVSFGVHQNWQSVCVILILSLLKAGHNYFGKQEKSADIKGLEAKLSQATKDINAINFKLGFSR